MAKNRVIIKIVTLIALLTYLFLVGPLVVLGNTKEEMSTNNLRNNVTNSVSNNENNSESNSVTNSEINSVTNSVTNSVEINKDKEEKSFYTNYYFNQNHSLLQCPLQLSKILLVSVLGIVHRVLCSPVLFHQIQ